MRETAIKFSWFCGIMGKYYEFNFVQFDMLNIMSQDTSKPRIHLICNAHLDPVWLWEWPEGAAEALSTFRSAADLCEEYGELVFNHNEVQLYEWIEEYEPELFQRIQRLVKEGKWHIMGGWYLQPDMNMPSGESIIRQMLLGHQYFMSKFGVWPSTAIAFDAFGHSRGVVQLLRQAGQDSYMFCRPNANYLPLESNEFVWQGYDGSSVLATRAEEHYHSYMGQAREKAELCIRRHMGEITSAAHGLGVDNPEDGVGSGANLMSPGHCLWGVGNHGGGPSRRDIEALRELKSSESRVELIHSTPELYFKEVAQHADSLPRHNADLNLWAPGCYISQALIKQGHRRLEQDLFLTEKMVTAAAVGDLMAYPAKELNEATRDLCVTEFHDILPGSSIAEVESYALQLIGHGREILSRIRTRAFFALAAGQAKAKEGITPILVYNAQPYPVTLTLSCEFNLADQNWSDEWTQVRIKDEKGQDVPSQIEKESSTLNLDWRKRVTFEATLLPGRINRFDAETYRVKAKPLPHQCAEGASLSFESEHVSAEVSRKTGLLESLVWDGKRYDVGAFMQPEIFADDADPWAMNVKGFNEVKGCFELLSPQQAAELCAVGEATIPPVRVVEDGAVRTVVEAYFGYKQSRLVMTYCLPKNSSLIEVRVRVYWHEKDRLLSLGIPQSKEPKAYYGQSMNGRALLDASGETESVIQQWVGVEYPESGACLGIINDGTYSVACGPEKLNLRLLRSPAYAAHPLPDRELLTKEHFHPRIDQGERNFRFWLVGGKGSDQIDKLDALAQTLNQAPSALSFFPSGAGQVPVAAPMLDNSCILLQAFKRAEDGEGYIVRLYNAADSLQTARLTYGDGDLISEFTFNGFEIKSVRWLPSTNQCTPCNLIEELVPDGPDLDLCADLEAQAAFTVLAK